jgi:Putative lumazine-binding
MKTLKSLLAGITLLFVCVAANASVKPVTGGLSKDDVIKTYIDAIAHGEIANLGTVLDNYMQYETKRGDDVTTFTKDQLIDYLKNNGTPGEPVSTNTVVFTDDEKSSVVKIEFKYNNFVRTDLVTLNKAKGWKITKIESSFK